MDVHIRDYRPADFPAIYRLDQECFEPGVAYSRMELMHYLGRRRAFALIAEQNPPPRITGFIVVEQDRRNLAHVITIDVSQAARRSGVGSALMRRAEERLVQGGCPAIYLETAVDNLAAIAFYKRYGYAVLSTIPRYYNGKVDALVMGKKLTAPAANAQHSANQDR